jgi:hypothetical protein
MVASPSGDRRANRRKRRPAAGSHLPLPEFFSSSGTTPIMHPSKGACFGRERRYHATVRKPLPSEAAVGETHSMDWKRSIVRGLDVACRAIDKLAYRPAVVRATMRVPRWWNCELARLSVLLDDRWHTGNWGDWRPGSVCDVCGRRAAWLTLGGPEEDGLDSDDNAPGPALPLDDEALSLCYWCHLPMPITTDAELAAAIDAARSRSIAWAWRWRSTLPY